MANTALKAQPSNLRTGRTTRLGTTWWVWVLAVFVASRVVSTAVLWWVSTQQVPNPWNGEPARPSLDRYLAYSWDGSWYENIARAGYPQTLPFDVEKGRVAANEWAFFPLFPYTARAVMNATGQPWQHVAPILATMFAAAAFLVVYKVIERGAWRLPATIPLRTVMLLGAIPANLILQAAYTESLALLLLATAMLLIIRNQHLWAALPVAALGFTRAVALPLAVVIVWQAVINHRNPRRPPLATTAVLLVVTLASAVAWPVITGFVTGVPSAYFQTQSAWRSGLDTSTPFLAFTTFAATKPLGWVLLVAAVVCFTAFLLAPATRRLGPELHAWTAAYPLYLLAATAPTTSLIRFSLLAFPALAVVASWLRNRVLFTAALIAVTVAASLWTVYIWQWTPTSGAITP